MAVRQSMAAPPVSGMLCAVLLLVPAAPVVGQRDTREAATEEAEWRLYEGIGLAAVTAGCFSIRHQSTWSADSLRYPTRFELSFREATGMGYHRLGTFETDMPALSEGGLRPIWRATSLDTAYIDPDPARGGGPGHQAFLQKTSETGEFVLETYWLGGRPLPGDDLTRGRLVGRAYGSRVACEEPAGASRRP